jgi:hypothetical protein
MKQPRRLKSEKLPGRAGQLLAVGSDEMPEPQAMHRAARQLGVSASVLAAATSVAGVASTTAAASAASASSATIGVAAGTTAGVVKVALFGVGLLMAVAVGSTLIPSSMPSKGTGPAIVSIAKHAESAKNMDHHSVSPVTSAERDLDSYTVLRPTSSRAPTGTSEVSTRTETAAPTITPLPYGAAVGRFEDIESEAATRITESNLTNSLSSSVQTPAGPIATGSVPAPVDPRLAREIASLDRARTYASRGAAAAALRELDAFNRSFGYAALQREAMLVRIDALLAVGRRSEAAATARALLLSGAPVSQRRRLQELAQTQE